MKVVVRGQRGYIQRSVDIGIHADWYMNGDPEGWR